MKFEMIKNVKLSTKFFFMVAVTALLICFLYGSFYLSFQKSNQYSNGINTINSLNQRLWEATVEEKNFLKDANQKSLNRVLALISQANKEIDSLREYQMFQAKDIESLAHQLEKYSSTFKRLSKILQDIDLFDKKIGKTVDSFGKQSYAIVALINEYEAECQIEMEKPNDQLIALRDVSKDATVTVGEIFAILKNDLFYKGDLESFVQKNAKAIEKLERTKKNVEVIKSVITKVIKEKRYFEYIDMVAVTHGLLSQTITDIYRLFEQKMTFENEFNSVRKTIAASKVKMISSGNEKIELLKRNVMITNFCVFCATLAVIILGGFLLTRLVVKPIDRMVHDLNKSADKVALASGQVSYTSQQLAEGSSEQAASLEETSSSLEEMASMIRKSAENANQVNQLMKEANLVVTNANDSMEGLTASMEEISRASEKTSKIIKTIDEIAFQTNLLALNAAVEAARAGEAGAGFAVVADEVRNLAMRSADASKNTAELIEGTVRKIKEGSDLVINTNGVFSEVANNATKVGELVDEIAAASTEQAQGIDQVNKAVTEMDTVVQQTAANAEESASASEEMYTQAGLMKGFVDDLGTLIGGKANDRAGSNKTQTSTHGYAAPKAEMDGAERVAIPGSKEVRPEQYIPMDDCDFKDF